MAAFTKKYGIKVKQWRAGSEAILQRIVSEMMDKQINPAAKSEGLVGAPQWRA
jgi:ABC-type Fe3+ transport system substrate-binding protein